MSKQSVLIVLHQEHSTPGRVGQRLRARGFSLDIRRPRFGDALPSTLERHAGAVIFGGPMSSNDPDDYIKAEIDWLDVPLSENKPFLGLCLGAQMLCKAIGGSVTPHDTGHAEIGYYDLHPTKAGLELFSCWPTKVFQWHREGMHLPAETKRLASGDLFPEQAFQVGHKAFGFQFHPELTLAMHHRWATHGAQRLSMPGAQPREAHFRGRLMHDSAVCNFLNRFLDHWIGTAAMTEPCAGQQERALMAAE